MIASNQLNDVQQLYLEFHALGDKAIELSVLKKLYDIGFRIFWFHANPECSFDSEIPTRSRCMEVYFINTHFQAKIGTREIFSMFCCLNGFVAFKD